MMMWGSFTLIPFVFFLGSSCTAVVTQGNDFLDKLHKLNTANSNLEPVFTNEGPSVRSHRRRLRHIEGDSYRGIKDALQGLSKSVKGIQGEYVLFEKALSKQRTDVEKMDQDLLAVKNDINEIQRDILLVSGTMHQLITEIQAVGNDTRKLEATTSDITSLVQQLVGAEKERAAKISELEAVTSKLISAVSLESLNKTIQDLVPAIVVSSTIELQQQVSELQSALENQRATPVTKSAPLTVMDDLQEALQQISELREKCVSKDELNRWLQNVTSIGELREGKTVVNKCSVNVRHEPQDGRTHLRLVMDPPNTENAKCK